MIGLRTEQRLDRRARAHHALRAAARSLVAAVFVGRLFLRRADLRPRRRSPRRPRRRRPCRGRSPRPPAASPAPALLVFALLVPLLFYRNRYVLDLGILVLTYVMLGWGLNIVVGLAGLLDLGYVAFYAVGAYSYALLAHAFRPVVLDLPAARRHPRRVLGRAARLPGAAAARRLSRHRHARLRRDHPHRAAQLARASPAARTASPASRGRRFFGLPFSRRPRAASPRPSASTIRRRTASSSSIYLILALALLTNFVTHPPAPAADRPRLGGAARGRDRLPLARHQHDQHQAHRLRHRRHVRRLRRLVLRHPPGLHQPGVASPSSNPPLVLAIVVLGGLGIQLGVVARGARHARRLSSCSASSQHYRMLVVRPRHGADHGLAAARPRLDATPSMPVAATSRPSSSSRAADERWQTTRSSRSSI